MQRDHHAPGTPSIPHPESRAQLGLEAPGSEPPRAQDHWRINLAEEWEVTFWSREFGCLDTELRKAVDAVGTNAGAVRAHLSSQVQQQRS
jgi:hypothetical protein